MIRTTIEVSDEDAYRHSRKLEETLDRLGFEPKSDPDAVAFRSDLLGALAEKGINVQQLVREFRAARDAKLGR